MCTAEQVLGLGVEGVLLIIVPIILKKIGLCLLKYTPLTRELSEKIEKLISEIY